MVGGGVTHEKSCLRFFLLKFQNLSIICINRGQQGQVVIYVLFTVKGVFGQKDRELCLNADRAG